MLDVSTLLLYNIGKTTTPFLNAAVNEALRQLVPFFHNGLFQLIDSGKFLLMIDLLLKSASNSIIHVYSETFSLFSSNPSVSQHAGCKSNSVRYEFVVEWNPLIQGIPDYHI